jgi:hypothetical protein
MAVEVLSGMTGRRREGRIWGGRGKISEGNRKTEKNIKEVEEKMRSKNGC